MYDHILLSNKIVTNSVIYNDLVSIIWYGSSSRGQDLHLKSDCDLHVILNRPNNKTISELGKTLEDFTHVDLSIIYIDEIYEESGRIIFQNGSKGLFFVYILADGQALYGPNIYKEIMDELSTADVRKSLLFTANEYISRLRIMSTHSPNDTRSFKKYCLKLLKDLLVLNGSIDYCELSKLSNIKAINMAIEKFKLRKSMVERFEELYDLETSFTKNQMAVVLFEFELLIREVRNGNAFTNTSE